MLVRGWGWVSRSVAAYCAHNKAQFQYAAAHFDDRTAPCGATHVYAAVQFGELTIMAASSRWNKINPASIKNN